MPQILAALDPPGNLVIVTRDEDDFQPGRSDGGHIPLILLGPAVQAGYILTEPRNDYDLLATIEDDC